MHVTTQYFNHFVTHTHSCTHTYTHTHAHTHTHTHTHARTHAHIHTHAHMHTCTLTRARTHIHTHTHAHARMHTYTHRVVMDPENHGTHLLKMKFMYHHVNCSHHSKILLKIHFNSPCLGRMLPTVSITKNVILSLLQLFLYKWFASQ